MHTQNNCGAKTPNIFSILKIFNLVGVQNITILLCMVNLLPSHSFKCCCGPNSHPRLLFFTPGCDSMVTSSKHMVSSPQHELVIPSPARPGPLSTYPPSCLDGSTWKSHEHTESTPFLPHPAPHLIPNNPSQKPSYPNFYDSPPKPALTKSSRSTLLWTHTLFPPLWHWFKGC